MTEVFVEVLLLISIYKFSGFHAHRFHVIDAIKHLIHFPHREIDYGDYVIMKDKTKVSTRHKIREKIRNFIKIIKKNVSQKITQSKQSITQSTQTIQHTTDKLKDKLVNIKK